MKSLGLILVGFLLGTTLFWGFSFKQHTSIQGLSKKGNNQTIGIEVLVENRGNSVVNVANNGHYDEDIQPGETVILPMYEPINEKEYRMYVSAD